MADGEQLHHAGHCIIRRGLGHVHHHEGRRHRSHRQRRNRRAARAGARRRACGRSSGSRGDCRPATCSPRAEGALRLGRHRARRPGAGARAGAGGRRRGHPPRVADPAVAQARGDGGRQRRRLAARVRGRARRGCRDDRARLVGRRLLAGAQGPRGRRVVADRRDRVLHLLQAQGAGRADPRRGRGRAPARARRPAAPRADLPARRGVGDPALLHRAAAARRAGAAVADPDRPAHRPPDVPGRARRRRRRGLPAGDRRARRARRVQHRRRPGPGRRRARPHPGRQAGPGRRALPARARPT